MSGFSTTTGLSQSGGVSHNVGLGLSELGGFSLTTTPDVFNNYVTEDGVDQYVTEDGASNYVTES